MWSSGDLSLVMFTFAPVLLLSELLKFAIKLTSSSYLMQPASSLLLFHTYFSRTFRDPFQFLKILAASYCNISSSVHHSQYRQ